MRIGGKPVIKALLVMGTASLFAAAGALAAATVAVNQVGYPVDAPKAASVVGASGAFRVVDEASGETVFSGTTSLGVENDDSSGDTVNWAVFSSLRKEGRYRVEMEGIRSHPFAITAKPYTGLKQALTKALYYQRCGTALDERHAGVWKHGACHMEPAFVMGSNGRAIDVTGGWHDAGDYGKYVAPGAVTAAMMLMAYANRPDAFGDDTGIPESGNGVPDILDEVKWELDWMLKMQRADGAVYHKATPMGFAGFVMPEADKLDMYVTPVSAAATGDLAGVNAMAAGMYRKYDAAYSTRLLESSKRAWKWLKANPKAGGFRNPDGMSSGEYGDGDVRDERFWAAASLYRATGDKAYLREVNAILADGPNVTGLGWASVGGFGAYDILFMKEAPTDLKETLRLSWVMEAMELAYTAGNDGYRIPMRPQDWNWGSCGTLMNKAVQLILASKLTGDKGYERVALNSLNWILGRNPLGVSMVTGFGVKSMMKPHHRPSAADRIKDPVPGMLSGGPNKGLQDDAARKYLSKNPWPAKAWIDNTDSYSTNEIAIYWNSPAIFAAAWFD